jgi:hypothetical protein
MKHTTLALLMLLLCQSAFSQSKKEQIETLIFQKDSLGRVLEKERKESGERIKLMEGMISSQRDSMVKILETERKEGENRIKQLEARFSSEKDSIVKIIEWEQKRSFEKIKELEASITSLKEGFHRRNNQIDSTGFEFKKNSSNFSNKEQWLTNEIEKINNSEMLLQFLSRHAAKYEDFDYLFFVIHGVQPPENFTFNLTNGISTDINEINQGPTNSTYNLTYGITGDIIKLNNDFKILLELSFRSFSFNIHRPINKSTYFNRKNDPFTDYNNSLKEITPFIKNQILLELDSVQVESFAISHDEFKKSVNETPFYKIAKNRIAQFKNDLKLLTNDNLIGYKISLLDDWKDKFYDFQNNDDQISPLSIDLGSKLISKNVASFISAQVFHDIVFFEINDRLVWFNIDK